MKAVAVIGSAWGDEGKGLLTDYFARPDSIVCRYSSGAQAGHTVIRDGWRHVFRHFGSGTLQGATTFLSKFFINNPILFFLELNTLPVGTCPPKVYVDPEGLVTTPWDMMINQIVEEARGEGRHGSCGVGINETMQRSEIADYRITVDDLRDEAALCSVIRRIMRTWVPERLHQLGTEPSAFWLEDLQSTSIADAFVFNCAEYLRTVRLSTPHVLRDSDHVVFEGAQGLLLDAQHRFFPHVTHARTGLSNVVAIAEQIGIDKLDVVYATRAYATRHGAGPFPREVPDLRYRDDTNVRNDWQGTLRFGHLDLDLLAETIVDDLKHATLGVRHGLAITCADQVSDEVAFWHNAVLNHEPRETFIDRVYRAIGADVRLVSYGPTARDVLTHS